MAASASQTVRTHRDLVVWQRAIDLVECAYRISGRFPPDERFGLTSQLQRAKGSLMEVETQVVIAGRIGYLTPEMQQRVLDLSGDVGRMLSRLIRALKARRSGP